MSKNYSKKLYKKFKEGGIVDLNTRHTAQKILVLWFKDLFELKEVKYSYFVINLGPNHQVAQQLFVEVHPIDTDSIASVSIRYKERNSEYNTKDCYSTVINTDYGFNHYREVNVNKVIDEFTKNMTNTQNFPHKLALIEEEQLRIEFNDDGSCDIIPDVGRTQETPIHQRLEIIDEQIEKIKDYLAKPTTKKSFDPALEGSYYCKENDPKDDPNFQLATD